MCDEKVELKLDHLQVFKVAGSFQIYELDPETKKNEEGLYDFQKYPASLVFDGGPDDECIFDAITLHFGTEKELLNLVYTDLDNMLEVLAEHFGFEGVQWHESESKAQDPLKTNTLESLDNRTEKKEQEVEIEIDQDSADAFFNGADNNSPDHGIPEWGDDDEEDN